MDIISGIQIHDLCLYITKSKTLVVSDFHMGFEEALTKQGMMIPRQQITLTLDRLKKTLDPLEINEIVITGDLKHEFGTISTTEWRHVLKLVDFLTEYSKKIFLIKGNHDKIVGPIARKRELKLVDYYTVGDVFICHGDRLFDKLPEFRICSEGWFFLL